jgi:hypothetical protein
MFRVLRLGDDSSLPLLSSAKGHRARLELISRELITAISAYKNPGCPNEIGIKIIDQLLTLYRPSRGFGFVYIHLYSHAYTIGCVFES